MAEAHQAVSYSTSLIHEHSEGNHDQETLHLVWESAIRTFRKRFMRFAIKVRNRVYPAHVTSLWIIIGIVMVIHSSSKKVPYDLVNIFNKFMPEVTTGWQFTTCCLVGFMYWAIICLTMRYTLSLLLMYKGYMFEARGRRISLKTKIWGLFMRIFIKWNNPTLFSFQGSLPRLPVPKVKDTMTRYLRSVRALLDDNSYERVKKAAKEFENGIGKKLQRYLVLKSWWSSNYVSDWWEEYVYLRSRTPLIVSSNIYGIDFFTHKTKSQSARAANITYYVLEYTRKIQNQELKPVMAQGFVPLCSWQYERLYNSVRVPGIEGDKIVHYYDSKHVVVLHKGCYYKMIVKQKGRLLEPLELQYQIEQILKSNNKASHGEQNLAALTAWDRTKWAQTRNKYFSSGVNKTSIHEIDTSVFMIILDDDAYDFDIKSDRKKLGEYARKMLHGKGNNIWFDKSFQFLFGTDGRLGLNGEHSLADAPALGYIYEMVCLKDSKSYDKDGNLFGVRKTIPPTPTRLNWEFTEPLLKNIDEAFSDAQKIISDVDHQVIMHDAFGKGFIKTCRLSPDAYIQMALQLAYYRDQGKFTLTYEASMTRLFLEGRTETVRSCTIESTAWVKAMENEGSNTEERIQLLNEACQRHQVGYLDAMCGRGVDRHLFCLYIVSKYLEVESPFLKEVINEPWGLSTSQTPHGQSSEVDLRKNPELTNAGGGFGPVSYKGYSVSYIISGEDHIFFHVSSAKSFSGTSTDRFGKRIEQAMSDIKTLFVQFKSKTK